MNFIINNNMSFYHKHFSEYQKHPYKMCYLMMKMAQKWSKIVTHFSLIYFWLGAIFVNICGQPLGNHYNNTVQTKCAHVFHYSMSRTICCLYWWTSSQVMVHQCEIYVVFYPRHPVVKIIPVMNNSDEVKQLT